MTLFVSGCTNHCKNCFQPETWNFDYGKPYTKETEDEIIDALKPSHISGLTLLGGEPFEPENQRENTTIEQIVQESLNNISFKYCDKKRKLLFHLMQKNRYYLLGLICRQKSRMNKRKG